MNWQPDNGRRRPGRPTKTWRTTFNEDQHDRPMGLTWSMDGCKEICQRQTEMEKARRPMFQQELGELRSKVRKIHSTKLSITPHWPQDRLFQTCASQTVTLWLIANNWGALCRFLHIDKRCRRCLYDWLGFKIYDWRRRLSHMQMTDSDFTVNDWRRRLGGGCAGH